MCLRLHGLVAFYFLFFTSSAHAIMDHLSLHEAPHGQGAGSHQNRLPHPGPSGPPMLDRVPPAPQQLPAQMFTTAAQLLDLTDSKNPAVFIGARTDQHLLIVL